MIRELLPDHFETAYYVIEWIIRIGALMVVPLRRTPDATRSWLLLIFFLPIPGLLLFLAIGRPRFPEWRRQRFAKVSPLLDRLAERLRDHSCDGPTAALAETLGRLPASGGNRIELIDDYDAVVDRLVADIDGARKHVRLLSYIFADDACARKVIDALARAVGRGISCHVLLDPVGSAKWRRRVIPRLAKIGVEVRASLPFRLLRGRVRRDMRNHRKLFLIDGRIGFAGSQNIVAKDFKHGIVNRELVARVEGSAVAAMEAVFLIDWYLETEVLLEEMPQIAPAVGAACAQLLPSGADYPLEGFETLLIWQVHEARERAIVVTPYFIPDQALIGAMRTAVARGVAVDLIVSRVADQRLVNLAQASYYDELMFAGVRVHRFRDELLHAKNVSIDGKLAVVGSANVDIRSFQLNEEVSLLLTDGASVARVEQIQRGYLDNSETLEIDAWRQRGRPRKLAENIARMVSPLL